MPKIGLEEFSMAAKATASVRNLCLSNEHSSKDIMKVSHLGLGHFPPDISSKIDEKSCLNRNWTDERSLY